MSWRLKRTIQCAKCPWKVTTNPHDIPNNYCATKHAKLKNTIATPGDLTTIGEDHIHVMACHEDHETHCLGWLMNQLGPGNNIALRIHIRHCENIRDVRLVGEQHETFEDTLPG